MFDWQVQNTFFHPMLIQLNSVALGHGLQTTQMIMTIDKIKVVVLLPIGILHDAQLQ